MALQFITVDDLKAQSFEQYINESSADFTAARDTHEIQGISLIKSKLAGRFDTDAIFDATGNDRHPLIVKVLSILVVYGVLTRNKARKIPEDVKETYKWANKWLNDVRDYIENPDDLPVIIDSESGEEVKAAITGNNSNTDFYI